MDRTEKNSYALGLFPGASPLLLLRTAVHTPEGLRLLKDGLLMSDQALRWLLILDMLESKREPMTADSLLSRLLSQYGGSIAQETQLRTIQRDLQRMKDTALFGLKVKDESVKPLQWYVDPQLSTFSRMGVEAAAALKLILRHVETLLPADLLGSLNLQVERADAVLARARINMPHVRPLNERIRMVPLGHVLQPPKLEPGTLECIFKALRSGAKVRAAYMRQAADQATERDFSVLGLVLRPPKYEVVALTGDRIYTMLLHRMSGATLLDEEAEWPSGFSLDKWLADGSSDVLLEGPRQVVLEADAGLARSWSQTPLAATQTVEPSACGTYCRITLHLPITQAFRGYLLQFGGKVRVIEPQSLRDWIQAQARALLAGEIVA